uniref:Lipase_3 domain-containing protein n=1 Tax=Haemonchus contortus TaxID=6289 RepID=A0A7I4YQ21_HAECO
MEDGVGTSQPWSATTPGVPKKELPRSFSTISRRLTSRIHPIQRWRNFTVNAMARGSKERSDSKSGLDPLDLCRKTRKFSSKSRRAQSPDPEFVHTWIHSSNFDLEPHIQTTVIDERPGQEHSQDDRRVAMTLEKGNSEDIFQGSISISNEQIRREDSSLSFESVDDNSDVRNSAEETWNKSREAKVGMFTALTAFYSLFLTIFALVLELSHLLSGEEQREISTKDMIFGMYMYGASILFFVYMYVVLLLDPRWYWTIDVIKRCVNQSKSSDSSISSAVATVRKVTHSGSSAGSLFLRLGCVVFGVTGVVYYAFLVFLCSSDTNCSSWSTALDVCAIVFIFTQMHFIFCNSKLSITGHHTAARLGTMHLMAANLWTWIRYVLMEEGVMEKEIRDVFKTISNRTGPEMDEVSANAFEHRDIDVMGSCRAAECILGSLSEVMFTAIVEYSLIAAAVMYIVWRNIGKVGHGSEYVKRKHRIRMDCSNTTTGLFLGLLFLAATFTSMLVYYGYSILGKSKNAAFAYALTDISQYMIATIGCATAIYQMRKLAFVDKWNNSVSRDQELLDQILLWLGLVGELIYSVAGLVGLTGDGHWQPLAFLLFFVHIFRLIQVGTQTFLIYLASRVKVGTASRQNQPGKQAITFLLAANLSIFLMNLFESEKPGISESIIDFYGKRSWVFLVRSFSPLTIFYRFHSSVCLAEIWKNVYANK